MPVAQVTLNLDAKAIKAGYLASCAYEWDQWGDSKPTDFLDALEFETAGNTKRDTVSLTLLALGRAVEEEEQEVTYRLALPA